jgi:hypothetical protein
MIEYVKITTHDSRLGITKPNARPDPHVDAAPWRWILFAQQRYEEIRDRGKDAWSRLEKACDEDDRTGDYFAAIGFVS